MTIDGHAVPWWRLTSLVGVVAGTGWWLVLSAWTGQSWLLPLGAVPWLIGAFSAGAALRRRWVRAEQHVLLEGFALALGVGAGAAWATGQPIVGTLDRLTSAMCVLFAFGRVGCLGAGCCHGRPWSGSIPRRLGLRRFPTQLTEIAVWSMLAFFTGVACLLAPGEGTALLIVVGVYGPIRFALEALRGDRRPRWLTLSEAQWTCSAALMLGIVVRSGSPALWLFGGSGVVLGLALWATRGRWLVDEGPSLNVLASRIRALELTERPTHLRHGDVSFAVSAMANAPPGTLAVSVHRAQAPLDADEARQLLSGLASACGAQLMGDPVSTGTAFLGVLGSVSAPDPSRTEPLTEETRPETYFAAADARQSDGQLTERWRRTESNRASRVRGGSE